MARVGSSFGPLASLWMETGRLRFMTRKRLGTGSCLVEAVGWICVCPRQGAGGRGYSSSVVMRSRHGDRGGRCVCRYIWVPLPKEAEIGSPKGGSELAMVSQAALASGISHGQGRGARARGRRSSEYAGSGTPMYIISHGTRPGTLPGFELGIGFHASRGAGRARETEPKQGL